MVVYTRCAKFRMSSHESVWVQMLYQHVPDYQTLLCMRWCLKRLLWCLNALLHIAQL